MGGQWEDTTQSRECCRQRQIPCLTITGEVKKQNKLNKVVEDYINSKKIRRVMIADDELISDKLKSNANEKLAKITGILNGNHRDYDAMANAIEEIEEIIDGSDTK